MVVLVPIEAQMYVQVDKTYKKQKEPKSKKKDNRPSQIRIIHNMLIDPSQRI